MTATHPAPNWYQTNKQDLIRSLLRIRHYLEHQLGETAVGNPAVAAPTSWQADWLEIEAAVPQNPDEPLAIDRVCQAFGLAAFDRDVLLLCAGVELDAAFGPLCAAIHGDSQRTYATLGLALSVLPHSRWSLLSPDAPLRYWRLIEIGPGNSLTSSPLRIDEQILHFLTGVRHLDHRLTNLGTPIVRAEPLVPSHGQIAEQLSSIWYLTGQEEVTLPILQLCGKDTDSLRAIGVVACLQVGLTPYTITTELLPSDPDLLSLIKRLWEREFVLNQAVLLVQADDWGSSDRRESLILQFIDSVQAPVILLSRNRQPQRQRSLVSFDVSSPTTQEQHLLWHATLNAFAIDLNGQVESLVSHFNLNASDIRAACTKAIGQIKRQRPPSIDARADLPPVLWEMCRVQARPRLDALAQRIESRAEWQELVLPDRELHVLQGMETHLRHRSQVYERWGFGKVGQRGLGISALFAGASGTGKTMAAEVLANVLRLDLYRIDLSAVVSKYIGETEKNLGRVFDAAEVGGVILLFDEADALFGKRSEVKDSHDRYANMEVAYLLQRMEAYSGLSILTTNLKGSIDQAFLRRIRFVVQFPFPDLEQRAEIWRRVFPAETPTQELDEWRLAKLNVAGGNIRNIALGAAFLAAEADQPVRMEHILQSARNEYLKLEKPLTDSEIKGWVSS